MATFTKRGTAWRAQVRRKGVSMSETFPTKAQAQAWANKVEADLIAGKLGAAPDKTFGDLMERYRDEVSPTKRGARWEAVRINMFLRDVQLADVPLRDLSPAVFGAWRDRRLAAVAHLSVLREWSLLSAICTKATKEWGWLHENPLQRVTKPEAPPPRTRRLVGNELDRILLALGYSEDAPPDTVSARIGLAALFAVETAMRAGEIVGLTWPHVDRERRLAHLPRTKNGHARDVPLSTEALRLLGRMPVGDGPVFGLRSGTLDTLWRKACAMAVVHDLHFHDLRREALSRLSKKLDVMTLAKVSGHRDLRILLNTYYVPDMADVAARLE